MRNVLRWGDVSFCEPPARRFRENASHARAEGGPEEETRLHRSTMPDAYRRQVHDLRGASGALPDV